MTVIFGLVLFVYLLTIAQLIYGFGKIKTYVPSGKIPKTYFSIVVPFRNEAKNLPDLLDSFKRLNYPVDLFEIILVDDFSEDHSQKLIYEWRMQNGSFEFTLLENIKLSGSPKKERIKST